MKRMAGILLAALLFIPAAANASVTYHVFLDLSSVGTTVEFDYVVNSLLTADATINAAELSHISVSGSSLTLTSAIFDDPSTTSPRVGVLLSGGGYDFGFGEAFDGDGHYTSPPSRTYVDISGVSSVPEPSALILLGSGLVGLVGIGRRRVTT